MKTKINIIAEELFQVSFIFYLLFILTDTVLKGFVSYFINLNILLIVVILSGVLMLIPIPFWGNYKTKIKTILIEAFELWDENGDKHLAWSYIFTLGIMGGLIVYFKSPQMGNTSLILALATSILIYIMSYIIHHDI